MAVPFMLGNFSQGLFGGAQSVFSLYQSYQGLSAQMRMQSEKDKAEGENKANANIPGGWNDYTGKPLGQHVDVANQLDNDPKSPTYGKYIPTPTADAGKPQQAVTPNPAGTGTDAGNKPVIPPTPVKSPSPNEVSSAAPASGGSVNPGAASDPYRNDAATGLPQPVAAPGVGSSRIPVDTRMSASPYNAAGVAGPAGSPSGPPQYSPTAPSGPPGTSYGLPGEPQPYAPPTPWIVQEGQRLIARGQEMVRGVAAGAHATNPATMPPSQMYGGTGFGPPALPPAYTAPTNEPIPSSQPGRPVIPPEQRPPPAAPVQAPISASPYNPAGALGGAGTQSGGVAVAPTPGTGLTVLPPGGGGEPVTGGVPQASAQPSIGGKLASMFSAFNPIGTAEAATRPTAGESAAANAAAPPAPAAPAAPAAALPPAKTETPTTPATATAPTTPAPAPVAVTGKGGQVAPDQKGPSEQSANTPVPLAPPVDPRYGYTLRQTDPVLTQKVEKLISQYGGGQVYFDQVAAQLALESSYGRATGNNGTTNFMQVTGGALAEVEAATGQKFDLSKPDDSLAVGILYDRLLATKYNLGPNTVQTNLAYRGGPRTIQLISQYGVEGAIQRDPEIAKYMDRVGKTYGYDKDIPWNDKKYYTGGNLSPDFVKIDLPTAVKAAQEQGPDGVLNYIATTGAPGMSMSEHWRAFQSAAEDYAIWSGHPEMIPQVIEYTAQLSHQGAVSNLMAADQALLRGDPATAAGLLMRAHASFPDGTYGRAGVDKSGNIWVQQFSENTGHEMGKPFQVSHEMIAQQMIALQHPITYQETLQKHQMNTIRMDLEKAHAKAYADVPAERLEAAKLRFQQAEDATEQRRQAAEAADATKREGIYNRQQQQQNNTSAADREISRNIGKQQENEPDGPLDPKDNKTPLLTPNENARAIQAQREMMLPQTAGGGELTQPMAKNLSQGLFTGKLKPKLQTDAKGNQAWGLYDAEGKVQGWLRPETVQRMMSIPGLDAVFPKPQAPGAPAAPARSALNMQPSPVGAGGNSYGAMSQGIGQNMAGITPAQVPPRQSAPQSMVA